MTLERGSVEISTRFLAKKVERLEHWRIAHGEENRVIGRRTIQVLMIIPERHDEGVALLPIEATLSDLGRAFAAEHMINDRARVAVLFSFVTGAQ